MQDLSYYPVKLCFSNKFLFWNLFYRAMVQALINDLRLTINDFRFFSTIVYPVK